MLMEQILFALLKNFVRNNSAICPVSLMERVPVYETGDIGPIPVPGTII